MTTRKKITSKDDLSISREVIKADIKQAQEIVRDLRVREGRIKDKRKAALTHVNGLFDLISEIEMTHDLRLSDLRNLENLMFFLRDTYDFKMADGDYSRFRFAEDVEKDRKEHEVH